MKLRKKVTFKNNAPFRSCISKVSSTLIDNAEDLDIIMPMCNLLEYSQNYTVTLGSLWNYYRDEVDNVGYNPSDGKSFKYKRTLVAKTPERLERPPQSPSNPDGSQPPRPLQPKVPTLNI